MTRSGPEDAAATVAICSRPKRDFVVTTMAGVMATILVRRDASAFRPGDVSEQRRMREGELLAGERLRGQSGEPFRRGPHLPG